jgi:DNA processing protein
MAPEEENLFYHLVAISTGGDYASIRRAKHNCANWRTTYERLSGSEKVSVPEKELGKLTEQNIRLVLYEDIEFPPLLREIPHPPFGIYVRGILPANDASGIAIVGTRRATPEGKSTARRFAAELARAGIVIVSGLAFGVDAAAHEGCLDARGTTIAVLACGLAQVYPRNNEPPARHILANGGAIISEYPPDMPAYPSRFLERNRIVSGLTKGTLVVEAPERSGSLATTRFALEQNRDVFVVPGPVTHPNFKGSHALIRQGAELVTTPGDILESYGVTKEQAAVPAFAGTPEEKMIFEILAASGSPQDIDKIINMTKLEPRIANQTVSFLLIKGIIKEDGAGYMLN